MHARKRGHVGDGARARDVLGGMFVEDAARWADTPGPLDEESVGKLLGARDMLANTEYARSLHRVLTERVLVSDADPMAADPMRAVFALLAERAGANAAFTAHRAALLAASPEEYGEALRGESPQVSALLERFAADDADRIVCLAHALGHAAAILIGLTTERDSERDITLIPRTSFLVYIFVAAIAGKECTESRSAVEAADMLNLVVRASVEFVTRAAADSYARSMCSLLETLYILEDRARTERAVLSLQALSNDSPTCAVLYTTMATAHVLRISELPQPARDGPQPPFMCMVAGTWQNRDVLVALDAYEPSASNEPALMQRVVMSRRFAHLFVRLNLVHRLPALLHASDPAPGCTFTDWIAGSVALYTAAAADL